MTVARSVSDVLNGHVTFEVECIDRMYCNVYVPQLQYAAGLVGYVHRQLGLPIASTAALARITDRFSREVHRFAEREAIPWVDFVKAQRKDDVMRERLAGFSAEEGVVFIGRAQEKTALFRTEKRRNPEGRAYPWIVKSAGVVNHFYFYCVFGQAGRRLARTLEPRRYMDLSPSKFFTRCYEMRSALVHGHVPRPTMIEVDLLAANLTVFVGHLLSGELLVAVSG